MTYDEDTRRIMGLHDTIKELRADNERLRADFLEYGNHKPDCRGGDGTICACGYLQAHRALEPKP